MTVGLCLRLFCGSVGLLFGCDAIAVTCGCCTWVCFGFAGWLFFVFLWFWFLLVCVISLVLIVLLCDCLLFTLPWLFVGMVLGCYALIVGEHFVF